MQVHHTTIGRFGWSPVSTTTLVLARVTSVTLHNPMYVCMYECVYVCVCMAGVAEICAQSEHTTVPMHGQLAVDREKNREGLLVALDLPGL